MATTTLNASQQNAFDLISSQLAAWGISTLNADLKNLILHGDTSPDTLTLALSNTAAYKTRFAGNDIRIKNGLQALQPAQYVATETSYRDILRSYGVPAGFYDTNQDLVDFIGKDVSPAELDARAKIAHDQYEAASPTMKAEWTQYFGKGDAIASILDPDRALALIQNQATQVQIGTHAADNGLQVGQSRAEQLQQAGVTDAQALQGYQQIAANMPTDQDIAKRFGTSFDQSQEENDLLLNQGAATDKRRTLYNEEAGLFNGQSGLASGALGVSQSY
jgi:hypothetical protein